LSRPAVVLVGIPAAGKSTVGGLLAQALGLELVETDDLVQGELGLSTTEAFADDEGQDSYHRAQERLAQVCLERECILALGSSAVESAQVRAALAGHRVIWLQISVVAATRRLGMARLGLEVLAAIRTKLDAQLAERAGWYEAVATEVIDTDRQNAEAIAAQILAHKEG